MTSSPSPMSPELSCTASVDEQPPELKKHDRFYFDDCMVTFRVQNELFRVHRFFLIRESKFFETMFSLPLGANDTEANLPIPLPDVTPVEFEDLLRFFYERMQELPDDVSYWSNLLAISTRFLFDDIRERAIDELTDLASPVDKIHLAKKYDVSQWLQSCYEALCRRPDPIDLWEAKRMGWETAVLLAKAREILRDPQRVAPSELQLDEPKPEEFITAKFISIGPFRVLHTYKRIADARHETIQPVARRDPQRIREQKSIVPSAMLATAIIPPCPLCV